MAELTELLAPFKRYVEARRKQPLKGIGDSLHTIHVGTEYEAEITFSQLEALVDALSEQPKNEGWIEWPGRPNIPPDATVEFLCDDGAIDRMKARNVGWGFPLRYRVVQP